MEMEMEMEVFLFLFQKIFFPVSYFLPLNHG